jgi:hypothetical protein
LNQGQLWAEIAQAALNFIVVNALTSSNQKATVTDMKTDLRTTKEDLMMQIKESEQEILSILNAERGKDGNGGC